MKELNLHGLVDQLVPIDVQCQTRPSDIVQLIVLDILSGRQALVHLESWAAQIDLEKLIRAGLTANQLNDDATGRDLDRLHEAGIHEIVSSFLLRTYRIEKLLLHCFHGDTTSKSVYGAYENPADTRLARLAIRMAFCCMPMSMMATPRTRNGIPTSFEKYISNWKKRS